MKMFNNMTLAYKEFKVIYDYIAETIWVWNKCDWYEYNEKCTNFFNLEKNCRVQNHICKLIFDENKITPKETAQTICNCNKTIPW